jgi:hypothetical protein
MAKKKPIEVGDTFHTQSYVVHHPDGDQHYWFLVPDGMTMEEAYKSQQHHGPFATEAEEAENQRIVLLGEQCKVTPGAPTSESVH